jgi:hypothetical protein
VAGSFIRQSIPERWTRRSNAAILLRPLSDLSALKYT